ncbi:hypothetical protein SmJEL517_g00073 [Synchytrium microbalum]|uniref:non-specific serine/threonine protein kinase n=1 Tax=Synchytrium microbalum TaxID=1806994 RepID=A0A507CK67_9FUNG|nr:uncharacterized protein SmJEL517_g00073 [Synchytrium microbalum]TPX38285.1 hypothetical protein SmJEL517_g00073 [Synchytrium microbalum]
MATNSTAPAVFEKRLLEMSSDISNGNSTTSISLELLLDTFLALYTDCKGAANQTEHIVKFVQKYDKVATRLQKQRVNTQDFDVVKVLATGAIGKVCLVKGKLDGKVYAMKVLKKMDLLTRREAAFFMEERNVLVFAQRSHWLTTLYAAFQDEENLYLVMDYVSGGSLRALIMSRDDPMPEEEAKFYVAEMLLSLEELHSYNYVHRDVKPENMLIDETGHVKLADFGSCMRLDEADKITSHETVGTPDYISPEILRALEGGVSYGKECDWWSLGIILFELLFDETPFYAESLTETYGKIMAHATTFAFPEDCEISADAKDIISKLICSKEERLGKNGPAEIKAHPWFKGIDFEKIRAHKPPFVPELDGPEDTKYFENEEDESKKFAVKKLAKDREFTGQNLNFIGYTYLQNARPIISFGGDLVMTVGNGVASGGSADNVRLQSLETEIETLKNRLQAEVKTAAAAQTAVRAAEEEVKSAKNKLSKEVTLRQELQERNSILETEKMKTQSELNDLRLLKNDASHEKAELEAKLAQVKRSLDADLKARAEIQELEDAKSKLESELNGFKSDLERELANSKTREAILSELTRTKAGLDVELQQATRKLQDELDAKVPVEARLSQLSQELSNEQSRASTLGQERVQLSERVQALTAENSMLQESLTKEQAAVEEATQRSLQLEQTKAGVEVELDALQKKCEALESERDQLIASSSKAQAGSDEQASAKLDIVTRQLDAAVAARNKATDELAIVNKRKAVLEVEVAELRKKLRTQEESTIESKSKAVSLQTQLSEMATKLAVLDDTNQHLSKQVSSTSEESKGMTIRHSSELTSLKNSVAAAASRMDEVEKTKRLLEADLEQATKRESETKETLKKLEARFAEVEAAVGKERKAKFGYEALFQGSEAARDELQREVERLQARHAGTKEEHGKSVREYQESMTRLRLEYSALEERHDSETKLRTKLEEDVARLAKSITTLEESVKTERQGRIDTEEQVSQLSEMLQYERDSNAQQRERERSTRLVELPETSIEKLKHTDGKTTISTISDKSSRKGFNKLFLRGPSPTKDMQRIFETEEDNGGTISQGSPLGSQTVSEMGSHRRMSTASSQGSLKSIHVSDEIKGFIKVPKGGKVKKGWVVKFAVVKDHKLIIYDRERDVGMSDGVDFYDIAGEIFVVKPVKQTELIHASGALIDFIFQIQISNKSGVPASSSLAYGMANSASTATMPSPATSSNTATSVDLHKKISKLTQEITVKEKLITSAEKMLAVTSGASHKQVEGELITIQDQLQILRAELKELTQQQLLVGADNLDEATIQEDEFLQDLALCKREYEKEIQLEEGRKLIYTKMMQPLLAAAKPKKQGFFGTGSSATDKQSGTQIAEAQAQIESVEKRLEKLNEDLRILNNAATRDAQMRIVKLFLKKNRVEEVKNHKFKLRQYNMPISCMQCGDRPQFGSTTGHECTACKMVVHTHCVHSVQQTCQDIANTKNLTPYYFMAQSQRERDQWIHDLEATRRDVDKMKSPSSFVGNLPHVTTTTTFSSNLAHIQSSTSSLTSSATTSPLSPMPEPSSSLGLPPQSPTKR